MDLLQKAEEIIGKSTAHTREQSGYEADYVMALTDERGYPTAGMITASKANGFKWIAFCTGIDSNKTKRIMANPRACVYLFNSESYTGISLTGIIEVITEIDLKRGMWYEGLENHFSGPEDENLCVLLFKPERYSLFIEYQNLCGEF